MNAAQGMEVVTAKSMQRIRVGAIPEEFNVPEPDMRSTAELLV